MSGRSKVRAMHCCAPALCKGASGWLMPQMLVSVAWPFLPAGLLAAGAAAQVEPEGGRTQQVQLCMAVWLGVQGGHHVSANSLCPQSPLTDPTVS